MSQQTAAGDEAGSDDGNKWFDDLPAAYAAQKRERRAAGCYEIFEAAQLIAVQLGLSEAEEKELLDALALAAFEEKLSVRSPGGFNKFAPTKKPIYPHDYCALVHVDDVNAWAKRCRFSWQWIIDPIPSAAEAPPMVGSRKRDDSWKELALARARELVEESLKSGGDWQYTQHTLAERIAEEKNIRGAMGGLCKKETIRDVLKGSDVLNPYRNLQQTVLKDWGKRGK